MALRIIEDITVPAKEGRALKVNKGQILRIHLIEGQQVGDAAFFNADNPREQFHVGQSWALNVMLGHGTSKALKYFYSKPPWENVMMTVVGDTVQNHFGNCAGRCSRKLMGIRDKLLGPEVKGCQENLAEALLPFGIEGEDINDVFNVFMNVELKPDGRFATQVPQTQAGDYIDLRAEMDIIAALSACPNETNSVNNFRAKPLGMRIYEAA